MRAKHTLYQLSYIPNSEHKKWHLFLLFYLYVSAFAALGCIF